MITNIHNKLKKLKNARQTRGANLNR